MARVLLVDDDAGVLDTCGAILRLTGLKVQTAACGRSALDALDGEPCELLIIDLSLPDINGLDVLAEARRRGLTMPAVVITGYASLETAVEAMRLGALDYLSKPVLGDALVDAVGRALGPRASGLAPTLSEITGAAPPAVVDDPGEASAALAENGTTAADGLAVWATTVCRVVQAAHDVPTVGRWAALLRISSETLHRWCRTARLPARASLDLARVLRAIRCAHRYGSEPDRFLAVSDRDALERVLLAGGIGPGPVPTVEEALARQTFVVDPLAVATLRKRLVEGDPNSRLS